jgi:hypothetical protein
LKVPGNFLDYSPRISGYDFIKLAYLLVLLAFIVAVFRLAIQRTAVAENNLPPFPRAGFSWKFDAESRVLTNPQGVQLYRLSEDLTTWQPVVPASLALQLPDRYSLHQSGTGQWQIIDPNGAVISSWNSETFTWVIGLLPTPTVPRPTATLTPTRAASLATIPPTATASLTPSPTLAVTVTPTTQVCSTSVKPRLTVGKQARLLINLNLHTTPEMTDNVFNGYSGGEVVDVLQGPICVPYLNGAYWWWQIRNAQGLAGWSVEAMLNGAEYFLAPIE